MSAFARQSDDDDEVMEPVDASTRRSRIPTYSTKEDPSNSGTSSSSSSSSTPGNNGGIGAASEQQIALINQRQNAFGVYQQHITNLVDQLESSRQQPTRGEAVSERLMSQMQTAMYDIFFGHDANGRPTDFYTEHGAAPICGMNVAQLAAVATQARTVDIAVGEFSEETLGFFRFMYEEVAQTDIGAPFTYIRDLMVAVQDIHLAAQALIQADPLFAVHRSQVAAEGGLAVRSMQQKILAAVIKGGIHATRSFLSVLHGNTAHAFNNWVRAENRSGPMAIVQFEDALARYDILYQRMPLWMRNCWVLPYTSTSDKYDATIPRSQNKPGADEVALSVEYLMVVQRLEEAITMNKQASEDVKNFVRVAQRSYEIQGNIENKQDYQQISNSLSVMAIHHMTLARGHVLENEISCYPRFLTMNQSFHDAGPLLAYYYALHGGQQQFLAEGRTWLAEEFSRNPQKFLRDFKPTTRTLATIRQMVPTGPVVSNEMLGQLRDGNTSSFQSQLNQFASKPGQQSSQGNFGFVQGQGGRIPITTAHQLGSVDGFGGEATNIPDLRARLRQQREQEEAARRDNEIQSQARLNSSREFQRGIRSAAYRVQQGQPPGMLGNLPSLSRTSHLRSNKANLQSAANAFVDPQSGVLAITNSPVYLYTRRHGSNIYNRGQPLKLFQILDNYFQLKPTNPAQLEQYYKKVGNKFVTAAVGDPPVPLTFLDGEYALDQNTVHNIALRILQNPYWISVLGWSTSQINSYLSTISRNRQNRWLGGDYQGKPTQGVQNPEEHKGGRKRKKTRKRKKKRKKTRRKMKHKRTLHQRKRKKRTRKK